MQIIGGDRVEVKSLMGPGVDPHLYKAMQGDISKLQNADMFFYSGLHLEGNMGEIFSKLSESKATFTLGESIDKESITEGEEGAIDPHIWFDLDLWKEALEKATAELKKYSPENADYFEENKQQYFSQIR